MYVTTYARDLVATVFGTFKVTLRIKLFRLDSYCITVNEISHPSFFQDTNTKLNLLHY